MRESVAHLLERKVYQESYADSNRKEEDYVERCNECRVGVFGKETDKRSSDAETRSISRKYSKNNNTDYIVEYSRRND